MIKPIITLDRLELFLLDLPQKSVFQSGIGTRKSKETLIVKWTDRDGRVGYGECSCRPDPYYSAEFLAAAVIMIEKFVAPQLQATQSYEDLLNILKRIRGWNFTKAAVEAAAFQIVRQMGHPNILTEQIQAPAIEDVPVGISLGIYEDAAQMHDVVQEAIEEGYQRVKFKIAPSVNIKNFDQINPLLFDNQVYTCFDANGSYRATDLEKMGYFINTYQSYIEQPTPPHRFDIFMKLKALFPQLKVCFDEEVKSMGDLVKLHSLGAIDELNLKLGRVGGISNSIEILNYCTEHAIPCWIGGMFETGIGRLQNLELAAHLPTAKAHDLSPSSRYFKEDIIAPEIAMKKGFINVATALKNAVVPEKMEKYTTHKISIKKPSSTNFEVV